MTKVTYSNKGFNLFYRSDLNRCTFRYLGINIYFTDVSYIPSVSSYDPDYYSFDSLNGAESAKIAVNKLPVGLRTKLDKIVRLNGRKSE